MYVVCGICGMRCVCYGMCVMVCVYMLHVYVVVCVCCGMCVCIVVCWYRCICAFSTPSLNGSCVICHSVEYVK